MTPRTEITSQRRRIAIVVPALEGGGGERVAVTLADQLALTHDVTVITFKSGVHRPSTRWSHHHITTRTRGPLRAVVLALRIRRVLRARHIEAALGVLTYTNTLLFLASLGWRGRPRLVASEHNPISSIARAGDWKARAQLSVLPTIYRRLPLVVVSRAIADELAADPRFTRARVAVVPNPVDAVTVRTLASVPRLEPPSVTADTVEIVCVARLHPQKGLAILLQAFARLPKNRLLTLVGDGPLCDSLKVQARELGVSDRVHFRGFLANPYPELKAAAVVVLASLWEGFGVVALEAAALGRPFIGTRCDGLQEVCRTLGYKTVTPGSVDELVEALIDPDFAGPDPQALEEYSGQRIAALYEELLLWPQT